ncbi:hypothetical protein EVAR_94067_1 [Eumeta japonica]|uniref:Uncharacterized protein n=1 Tax=Eumeta variegata TaxID=151549 RepID=A0A4C1V7R1_EUMVA|nr:hypothetical protein EVAR_94067_1 [Eumeta japonica]
MSENDLHLRFEVKFRDPNIQLLPDQTCSSQLRLRLRLTKHQLGVYRSVKAASFSRRSKCPRKTDGTAPPTFHVGVTSDVCCCRASLLLGSYPLSRDDYDALFKGSEIIYWAGIDFAMNASAEGRSHLPFCI